MKYLATIFTLGFFANMAAAEQSFYLQEFRLIDASNPDSSEVHLKLGTEQQSVLLTSVYCEIPLTKSNLLPTETTYFCSEFKPFSKQVKILDSEKRQIGTATFEDLTVGLKYQGVIEGHRFVGEEIYTGYHKEAGTYSKTITTAEGKTVYLMGEFRRISEMEFRKLESAKD